jgi:SAM-dependent methyltransferase
MGVSADKKTRPRYGNWVSARLLFVFGIPMLLLVALSFFSVLLIVPAVILAACFVYFAYARYEFWSKGADIQSKVQELVLKNLQWDGTGRVLDIGCGDGALAIATAKAYPAAEAVGIDYWGGNWQYTKALCEDNARLESVETRVTFRQASASALPFESETFDLAISNMVFHEVRSDADKSEVVREALRIVRKGGKFVFQDLFLWRRIYGDVEQLLATIRGWGIEEVSFVATCESEFIPKALKLPFMLGTAGILFGTK